MVFYLFYLSLLSVCDLLETQTLNLFIFLDLIIIIFSIRKSKFLNIRIYREARRRSLEGVRSLRLRPLLRDLDLDFRFRSVFLSGVRSILIFETRGDLERLFDFFLITEIFDFGFLLDFSSFSTDFSFSSLFLSSAGFSGGFSSSDSSSV